MSAESLLVDLRRSLVIADPQHFPMNMEKPYQEDRPAETYPIMAYEASNVMPTPFGYKSFFDESSSLNIGNLSGQLVQDVFTYQTSVLDSIQFALCEDGIYVAFATEPTPANWAKIIDTSVGLVVGGRRLWTVAVIANTVYLYQAGQPTFWAIVDPAKYAEAATPSLIAGATRTQVWTNWGAGIISYVPSFLNMAGQLGLFRADNRLGFWDSDNSIGWSSSVAIEDFKPDAKTFAGSTKFADVQGRIVKVLGSGDNFIIYATRSIVRCIGLDNSPEKWRGEAIMSEVGISFDTQVVAAQPDQIHYCITQAGICSITDGNPEYIATEVMDYIASKFPLYSLFLIEGRYLFISVNGAFPGSEYGTESVIINDWANNSFNFPRPTYPALEDGKDFIEDYIKGREHQIQEALKDYSPIVDISTIPEDQVLEPCFDVSIFKSTWSDSTFSPINAGSEYFYSKLNPAVSYYQEPLYIKGNVTNNFIEEEVLSPGDFAGQEFADKLNLGMIRFNQQLAYQNAIIEANDAAVDISLYNGEPTPPPNWDGKLTTVIWDKKLLGTWRIFDALSADDIKGRGNGCRIKIYTDSLRALTTKVYFQGSESYRGNSKVYVMNGPQELYEPTTPITNENYYYCAVKSSVGSPSCAGGSPQRIPWSAMNINQPAVIKVAIIVPTDLVYKTAYINWCIAEFGMSLGSDSWEYAQWMLYTYPQLCVVIGGSAASIAAYKEPRLVSSIAVNIVTGHSTNPSLSFHPIIGWPSRLGTLVYENPTIPWEVPYSSINTGLTTTYEDLSPPTPVIFTAVSRGETIYYNPDDSPNRWTLEEYDALTVDLSGPRGYRLDGQLITEITLDLDTAEEHVIYEMELSGWGYYPPGGFSFRKTHNRNSSRPTCPMPGRSVTLTPPVLDIPKLPPLDRPDVNNPPYVWEYPPAIPLPPNHVLFQKGSVSPYYPTYGAAAVYDLLLQKWGTYNNPHKLIQELVPVNRVDSSIMPVADKGMFAGALTTTGLCSVFKERNPASRITYGKMAFYRRGMSLATGAIAHFGEVCSGTLIVEASMDGVTVDPLLSYAVPFVNQRNVTLPFTTRAKWFNIRVEGNFNLTYLELLAEPRGRR